MQTGASLAPRFPRESTGDSALTAGTREKQERVRGARAAVAFQEEACTARGGEAALLTWEALKRNLSLTPQPVRGFFPVLSRVVPVKRLCWVHGFSRPGIRLILFQEQWDKVAGRHGNFGPFPGFSPALSNGLVSYFDAPSVTEARFFDVTAKPLEPCRAGEQIDTSAQVSSQP